MSRSVIVSACPPSPMSSEFRTPSMEETWAPVRISTTVEGPPGTMHPLPGRKTEHSSLSTR